MKASPKWLLILALSGLAVGVFVASSHRNLPLAFEIAMPLGAIFTGLFLVSLLLKKEVVKFNEDESFKIEAIKRYQSFYSPKKLNEEDSGAPRILKAVERRTETRDEEAVERAVEAWRNEGDPN